jgi:hypothetical protein
MKSTNRLALAVLAACIALSACSLTPTLTLPDIPVTATYKEQVPWTPAQPADGV